MILYFRINKEQKEALLSLYPDIKSFVEKTISEIADKIIMERDLFDVDKDLKEYHDRRVLNNYKIHGRECTQETKNRISEGLKKYYAKFAGEKFNLFPETKKKIGLGNKGKIISKGTREKISLANKGKKRTKEQRINISLGHKGLNYKKKIKLIA